MDFDGERLLKAGRWLRCYVKPIVRGEEMVGRLWTLADITNQKQAERQIADFKQELKHAHELAKMGEWTFDCVQQTFTFSNDILELFGLSEDHKYLSLEGFLEVLDDEHRSDVRRQFYKCQKYGESIQAELQLIVDGRDCYVILRGRLKVGNNAEDDVIQGVLQDISDLRTSEYLVKLSSHFFSVVYAGQCADGTI